VGVVLDGSGFNYRREGGYLIALRLASLQQLFNSFDPAPFHDKDLNAAVEEYIVESAAELPIDAPLKLVIHLAEGTSEDQRHGVPGTVCLIKNSHLVEERPFMVLSVSL